MRNIKFIVASILVILSLETYSQIGITSYSVYSLGINTSQNRLISGEIKAFTNRMVEDIQLEVDGFINFKPGTYHRFSIGLGLNAIPFKGFDPIYAITVPASIEIYPLQDFRKVSILFELTPEILPEDGVNLRSMWGIRYTFGQ
jgi:hypothetical protein